MYVYIYIYIYIYILEWQGWVPTMQINTYGTHCLYPLHPPLSISLHPSASHIHMLMFSIRHMAGVGAEEQRVLNGSYIIRSAVCT